MTGQWSVCGQCWDMNTALVTVLLSALQSFLWRWVRVRDLPKFHRELDIDQQKQTVNIWHFSKEIWAPWTQINLSIAALKPCCIQWTYIWRPKKVNPNGGQHNIHRHFLIAKHICLLQFLMNELGLLKQVFKQKLSCQNYVLSFHQT